MDDETLKAYDSEAAAFARQYEAMAPASLHAFVERHFHATAPTADVGCGSGRDAAWLQDRGFPTVAFDGSAGMILEARRLHPGLDVREAHLPNLAGLTNGTFANVLCSGVLMHLARDDVSVALTNLVRILKPGGRLVLSLRGSRASAGRDREPDGRLFTTVAEGDVASTLATAGARIIDREEQRDTVRDGVFWLTVAAEKHGN